MAISQHPRRADIDGLRAVAIVAVIVFHAFPRALPGGYAGVDVFFVISGYLISRIIIGEGFSFAGFYARRLRRIVPALAIVLAACLVAGWFLLLADEYERLGKHVAGGAGFVANLVLWSEVGYFDTAAATKPLLHLWSLGIEEQFYLVWPLVLWLGRRRGLAVTLVAFALSFGATLAAPQFYAPWTRLWELLIGAALAQVGGRNSTVLGAVGAVAIAAGIAIPLHDALLIVPTLGTACVIASGETTWLARRVLAQPIATWLGRISFPLYLWHWPMLVFMRLVQAPSPMRLVAIAASIALADLTYRLVERPIQRGPTQRIHVLALAAALFAVCVAGFSVDAHEGFPDRAVARGAPDFGFTFASTAACYAAHPYAQYGVCYESPSRHARLAVMLGDSHGDALGPGLIDAKLETDLRMITRAGCMPFRGVEYVGASGDRPYHCRDVFDAAIAEILADPRVSTVILVARHAIRVNLSGFGEPELVGDLGHFELADGTHEPAATVYRRALADTIAALQARGIRVVFVDQVPELGFNPRGCVSRFSGKHLTSCSLPRAAVVERQRAYRAIVDEVLAHTSGVIRVDPMPLFCTAVECSAWRGDEMMYHDDDHLGPRGADVLAAEIAKRLQ